MQWSIRLQAEVLLSSLPEVFKLNKNNPGTLNTFFMKHKDILYLLNPMFGNKDLAYRFSWFTNTITDYLSNCSPRNPKVEIIALKLSYEILKS